MAKLVHDFVAGDTLPTLRATLYEGEGTTILTNVGDSGISATLRFRTVELPSRAKGATQERAMTLDPAVATNGYATYQWLAADLPALGKGVEAYEIETEVEVTDASGKILTSADSVVFKVRHQLGSA
jgi:hypothetical protein